jgi:hypothetical protein
MQPLRVEAMQVADRLREARLQVTDATSEFVQAAYDLAVAKARVERGLIKKVGHEKALGPTTESRERVFILARDADEQYVARLKRHNEVTVRLDQAKVEEALLGDRLKIMLTAMRAGSDES